MRYVNPLAWIDAAEKRARTVLARERCKPRPDGQALKELRQHVDMLAHIRGLIIDDMSKGLAKDLCIPGGNTWRAESPCRRCARQEICVHGCTEFLAWVHNSWTLAQKILLGREE